MSLVDSYETAYMDRDHLESTCLCLLVLCPKQVIGIPNLIVYIAVWTREFFVKFGQLFIFVIHCTILRFVIVI